jgi:hypothetical protein
MPPISQSKSREKTLSLILVFLILIFLALFGQNYLKNFFTFQPEKIEGPKTSLKEYQIDFEILANPLFQSLTAFPEIPLPTGPIGRQDPFQPSK